MSDWTSDPIVAPSAPGWESDPVADAPPVSPAEPAPDNSAFPSEALQPELVGPPQDDDAAFGAWKATQLGLDPAKAGSAWALATRRKLSPTWVAQNLDAVKEVEQREDLAMILREHPGLAEQFRDPVKGAVLQDALAEASLWERMVTGRRGPQGFGGQMNYVPGGILRAIMRGADQEYNWLSAKKATGHTSIEEDERLRELQAGRTDLGAQGPIEKAVYGAAEMVPFIATVGGAAAAAAALGAPAAVVAGVSGAVMGGLTFLQTFGPVHDQILAAGTEQVPAEYDAQGNELVPAHEVPRVDPDVAFGLAAGVATVSAPLAAALGPEALAGVPVVGKYFSRVARDGVASVVAQKTLSKAVEDGFRAWGSHWVAGVGMMVGQTAINSGAARVAGRLSADLDPDWSGVGQDVLEAARHAAGTMAILSTWGPARDFYRDVGRIGRSKVDAANLDLLARSVRDASSVPDREVERVIGELRQDGLTGAGDDHSTVYLDQRGLRALAEREGVDPGELAKALVGDDGQAYEAARASGGALPIPIERYAARVARAGLHEVLKDDVRFSPDGLTPREAAAAEKVFAELQKQATPEVAGQLEGIRQRWMDSALAAGRGKAEARIAGDHMAAIVGTAALREGVSPAEWVRAHPLPEVYGPGMKPQGGLEQPPAPQSPAFKEWFGDSKVVDAQGKPLVMFHGTAGDFTTFSEAELGRASGGDFGSTKAFFFAKSKWDADFYKDRAADQTGEPGRIVDAYLSIKNPLVLALDEADSSVKGELFARLTESNGEALQYARDNGYDGVIWPQGNTTDHGYNAAVFSPEQIKSATGNRGTFSPTDANILHQPGRPLDLDGARATVVLDRTEARGKLLIIETPNGKRYEIHLGKDADASTLAHETTHWLVDTLMDRALQADAPADIKADMDALARWMGYSGGTAERAKGLVVKNEERASHAWEQYLAEGRAPTEGLQRGFDRFARWMAKLYGQTTGLGEGGVGDVYAKESGQALDVTPEVRAIFDRLLATADEMESTPSPLDIQATIRAAPEADRPRLQARARVQQVRSESARALLVDRPVSQLRPEYFLREERKAAREALDAARAGKAQEALDADARRGWAKAMRDEAKKLLRRADVMLRKLDALDSDDKRAELGRLVKPVLDANGRPTGEQTQPYLEAHDALMAGLDTKASTPRSAVERRAVIQAYVEHAKANGQDVILPDSVLRNLDRQTRTRDLTFKDLSELHDAVTNLQHLGHLKSTLLENGVRRSRDVIVGEAVAQVEESLGSRPLQAQDVQRTLSERLGDWGSRFILANVRPEFLISRLDGGKSAGIFRRVLWNVVNDAENAHGILSGRLAEALHQTIQKMPTADLARWAETRFQVNGQTFDLRAALAVALNWGTSSNRGKLVRGWSGDWVLEKGIRQWTESTPQEFLQRLTVRDWEFVQQVWRTLDSMWPAEVALEQRLVGLTPEKVEGLKFQVRTADGATLTIEGGYYPMIYDRRWSRPSGGGAEASGPFNPDYNRAAVPSGHLISRIEGFARPVELSIDPLARKVVEHAKDVTMREALISAYEFLTDERVRTAIQRSEVGDVGYKALLEWVRERANDFTSPDNGSKVLEQFFTKAQNGVVGAIFSFNVGQTIQNLTGVVSATKAVGAKWMAEASLQFWRDPEGSANFVRSQSTEMAARNITGDLDLRDELRRFGVKKSRIDMLNEAGRAFWESTDKALAYRTWLADFNRSLAPESEGGRGLTDLDAARRLANQAVTMHVMAGRTKDLPPALRNKVVRAFLPFFGFLNHRFNMMYEAKTQAMQQVRETGAEGSERLGIYMKTMGSALAAYMVESLLSKLVTGQGPEKKKKEKGQPVNAKDWARFAAWTAATSPFAMFPIAGAIGRSVESGRDVNFSPQAQLYSEVAKTGQTLFKAVEEPSLQHFLDAAVLASTAAARARGLPVTQAKATGGYVTSVATGQHKPKDPGDVYLGLAFGKRSKLKASFYGKQREPPKTRH